MVRSTLVILRAALAGSLSGAMRSDHDHQNA
jgi:hypothetical protein